MLGVSLGSTAGKVLGSDEGIKLVSTYGKLLGVILIDLDIIKLGIGIGMELGSLDGCFDGVNDVIADKNVVTKIMNNSTGLQRIELNGFDKRHWQTGYYPFAYGWCLGLC